MQAPTTRRDAARGALVALCPGSAIVAIIGLQPRRPCALLQGGALVVLAIGASSARSCWLLGLRMAGWSEPEIRGGVRAHRPCAPSAWPATAWRAEPDETEFMDLDPYDDEDFEELVRDALDELPDLLQRALEHNVAVVISDGGRRPRAYGLYHGDGVARDDVPDRIVIYRDTLRRDFGHDPDLLRDQVTRTVRHELAHHLGFDELGVRDLGL